MATFLLPREEPGQLAIFREWCIKNARTQPGDDRSQMYAEKTIQTASVPLPGNDEPHVRQSLLLLLWDQGLCVPSMGLQNPHDLPFK